MEVKKTVLDLEAPVSRRELLRSLGYPRGKAPSARVAGAIDSLRPVFASLASPRGAFRLVAGEEVRRAGMPAPSTRVAIGLCTIGPALEDEVSRRGRSGDDLSALVFDAYGSSAAESAAKALSRYVCEAARATGLFAARRISPGYGRWDVKGQRDFLALLPARELGVELTEGCMMVPRKSVSFAMRLVPEEEAGARASSRCGGCDRLACPFREQG